MQPHMAALSAKFSSVPSSSPIVKHSAWNERAWRRESVCVCVCVCVCVFLDSFVWPYDVTSGSPNANSATLRFSCSNSRHRPSEIFCQISRYFLPGPCPAGCPFSLVVTHLSPFNFCLMLLPHTRMYVLEFRGCVGACVCVFRSSSFDARSPVLLVVCL